MRYILHDWADSYCLKILEPLRKAAGPNTKLVVVDRIVPLACRDDTDVARRIPGAMLEPAPEPLLANYGVTNLHMYLSDLQVRPSVLT